METEAAMTPFCFGKGKPLADLEDEAARLSDLLRGKVVRVVRRHRSDEMLVEFDDGTRLFVNKTSGGLEFSVT
jgi:hypothetical protein